MRARSAHGRGVEALERFDRGPELLAGEDAIAGSPQALAVREPRARRLELVERLGVVAERLLEQLGVVAIAGQQAAGAQRPGQ